MSQLTWTVLPNGITDDGTIARLSVHLDITTVEGSLVDHEEFLTGDSPSWPPDDITFDVVIGPLGGAESEITRLTATPVELADSATWGELFEPDSPSSDEPFVDRTDVPIHTYPSAQLADFIRDAYVDAAVRAPETGPKRCDLLARGWRNLAFTTPAGNRLEQPVRDALDTIHAGEADGPPVVDTRSGQTFSQIDALVAAPLETVAFAQLRDYYTPPDLNDELVAAAYAQPLAPLGLNLRRAISAINAQPFLQRLFGLVFDLEIPLPAPRGDQPVYVVPRSSRLATSRNRLPATMTDTTTWLARPRAGSDYADGYLRLEEPETGKVIDFDLDGGALGATIFAGTLLTVEQNLTIDTPETTNLPALRNQGLMVTRPGNAATLHAVLVAGLAAQEPLNNGQLILFADDLVRGLRFDVRRDEGSWQSLMRRSSTYVFPGTLGEVTIDDEEGYIPRTPSARPGSPDWYLSETLLWLDGWSPILPRPGRVLNADLEDAYVAVEPPTNDEPDPDFPVLTSHGLVPGSQTALRAGSQYTFRARIVDLAGNSVPVDDNASHATEPVIYRRFQPLNPPDLALRTSPGAGEDVTTVVLRSDVDTDPSPATSQRHLVPPRSEYTQAEILGLLDRPDGTPDPARYAELAQRDAADLSTVPGATPDPDRPGVLLYGQETITIDWLADPWIGDMNLRVLDGPYADAIAQLPITGISRRLIVNQGDAEPTAGAAGFTVPLRKADIVHVRLTSVPVDETVDLLGIQGWMRDDLDPAQIQDTLALIATGRHVMVSPPRDLTLVHAVRRPLLVPGFADGSPTIFRRPDATWAGLGGTIEFHRRSTVQLEIGASWEEYTDAGPGGPPPTDPDGPDGVAPIATRDGSAVVLGQLDYDGTDEIDLAFDTRQEFGDTRHRQVAYDITATSRFVEYFAERVSPDPTWQPGTEIADLGPQLQADEEVVPGSITVIAQLPGGAPDQPLREVKLVERRERSDGSGPTPGHYVVDREDWIVSAVSAGEAAAPTLAAIPDGTPLKVLYTLPPVVQESGQTELISVPASARPQSPVVKWVVPAFDLTHQQSDSTVASVREGGWLRVYLDRPWWTSGESEMLGVLTYPAAELQGTAAVDLPADDPLRPYVTQWGEDPVLSGEPLPLRYPPMGAFPEAQVTEYGVRLAEDPGAAPRPRGPIASLAAQSPPPLAVNVAGHAPVYDADRDLWAVDVKVLGGRAYRPFTRLALARYQPESLTGLELSEVVLADLIQLDPDRFVSVTLLEDFRLAVALSGITYTEAAPGTPLIGRAYATVEVLRDGFTTEDPQEVAYDSLAGSGRQLLESGPAVDGVAAWTGQLGVAAGQDIRVVFEQYELIPVQTSAGGIAEFPGERLVHTDTIRLRIPDDASDLVIVTPDTLEGPITGLPEIVDPVPAPPPATVVLVALDFGPDPSQQLVVPRQGSTSGEGAGSTGQFAGPADGAVAAVRFSDASGAGSLTVRTIEERPGGLGLGITPIGPAVTVIASGVTHGTVEVDLPAPGNGPERVYQQVGRTWVDVTLARSDGVVTASSNSLSTFVVGLPTGYRRFAGPDRIATAIAISEATFAPGVRRAYLATAGNFPDALAAGPPASMANSPVLLVGDSLSPLTGEELVRLDPCEVVILGSTAAVSETVAEQVRALGFGVRRVAGPERFSTAAAISEDAFPNGASIAYIATGEAFPDALAGGTAAARDRAPMLLVQRDGLPAPTEAELRRLSPSRIVILGGEAAVSAAVADQLGALGGARVERYAGPDRFSTAAAVAASFGTAKTVFVATGNEFPDALAGVPAAGIERAALVLVQPDAVPDVAATQLSRLRPDQIVVLGGTAAIGAELDGILQQYLATA